MQDKLSLISHTPVSSATTFSNNKFIDLHHVSQPNSLSSRTNNLHESSPRTLRPSLLSIPAESLTHITTYVDDPQSLFALSRVNRRLRDHIADDNTWYRVFAFHFLRVGPESDPEDEKRFMLRRSENTWKKEFVRRFNIVRRWEKSRSSAMSYQPHYWSVSGMHLLENASLLTANLQYGIVTRSFPLTGKILKGYLDASGTTNGLGIGNPNEEFSPNVSCIALSSCGGTGRIAWGFRNGEVAATSAPRVMDSNRSAARFTRCTVDDEHSGDVRCVLFAGRDDELVISGCAHGEVKLWDARRMQCLWTGFGKKEGAVVPDPCVKTEYCGGANVLVAALQKGDVMVWWGFQLQDDGAGGRMQVGSIQNLRVAQPAKSTAAELDAISALFVDPDSSPSKVKILVHYANERHFLRIIVDLPSGIVTFTRFYDGPLGPITSLKPCFVIQDRSPELSPAPPAPIVTSTPSLSISRAADLIVSRESSFMLAGDSLGRVSVWPWDAEGTFVTAKNPELAPTFEEVMAQASSTRRWEAHDDGAVCVIEVNNAVIITGSSRGTLKVWDGLTFAPLRSFASPASKPSVTGQWDPVGHIVIRGDLLVASVGSRILVWQAGAVSADKKSKAKHGGKPKGRGTGSTLNKWQQQIELNRDIRESQRLLDDERAHAQHVHGRARDQLSTLDRLGLSETEAVEYLLMLSREEEDQRRASEFASVQPLVQPGTDTTRAIASDDTEGVFTFDEYSGPGSVIHGRASPALPPSSSSSSSFNQGPSRAVPRASFSSSNSKVQVSPPFIPEPTMAGFSGSPLLLPAARLSGDITCDASPVPMSARRNSGISMSVSSTPTSSLDDVEAFPAMGSPSGTPSRSTPSRSASSLQLTGSWTRGSPSSILRSEGGSNAPRHTANASLSASSSASQSSLLGQSPGREEAVPGQEEEEDDELRFVLELSLAEAMSRGEQ